MNYSIFVIIGLFVIGFSFSSVYAHVTIEVGPYEIAKSEGLKYVYLGNVPGHPWEHTYCAGCNEIVVKRFGFDIHEWNLDKNNKCKFCGNQIPITGSLAKGYKQERFQFVV